MKNQEVRLDELQKDVNKLRQEIQELKNGLVRNDNALKRNTETTNHKSNEQIKANSTKVDK